MSGCTSDEEKCLLSHAPITNVMVHGAGQLDSAWSSWLSIILRCIVFIPFNHLFFLLGAGLEFQQVREGLVVGISLLRFDFIDLFWFQVYTCHFDKKKSLYVHPKVNFGHFQGLNICNSCLHEWLKFAYTMKKLIEDFWVLCVLLSCDATRKLKPNNWDASVHV